MERDGLRPSKWEAIDWQETPYPGVFIYKLGEEIDSENPKIPLFTTFAVKVTPGAQIHHHIHKREERWQEKIIFSNPNNFDLQTIGNFEGIIDDITEITIKPYEIFGIKNNNVEPLYFISHMEPGFTGYQEIEEIKLDIESDQAF